MRLFLRLKFVFAALVMSWGSVLVNAQEPPPVVMDWSNSRPEQRQALDSFYQSLRHSQEQNHAPTAPRWQNIEQLRTMSPEQRQQRFQEFKPAPVQPLLPANP